MKPQALLRITGILVICLCMSCGDNPSSAVVEPAAIVERDQALADLAVLRPEDVGRGWELIEVAGSSDLADIEVCTDAIEATTRSRLEPTGVAEAWLSNSSDDNMSITSSVLVFPTDEAAVRILESWSSSDLPECLDASLETDFEAADTTARQGFDEIESTSRFIEHPLLGDDGVSTQTRSVVSGAIGERSIVQDFFMTRVGRSLVLTGTVTEDGYVSPSEIIEPVIRRLTSPI
ncbi:MAG: hypothetical protein RIE08_07190 [Acidimicrobiales bacterium]